MHELTMHLRNTMDWYRMNVEGIKPEEWSTDLMHCIEKTGRFRNDYRTLKFERQL